MKTIPYSISPDATAIGLAFEVAVIKGVSPTRQNTELDAWKRAEQKVIRKQDWSDDKRLAGYREVLAAAGNPAAVASPEFLLQMLKRSGRLPAINSLVDAYNVISIRERAVVSAHDLDELRGSVRLVRLSEPLPFEPLGNHEVEEIPAGEFGVQDDRHMLCRLNCKQSRLSSVMLNTEDVLIYVQGNNDLQGIELATVTDAVCDAVIQFNGGERVPTECVEFNALVSAW